MMIIWPPRETDSVSGHPLAPNIGVGPEGLILNVAGHACGQTFRPAFCLRLSATPRQAILGAIESPETESELLPHEQLDDNFPSIAVLVP